jgi:two-component system sensor histidine kinase KdpD
LAESLGAKTVTLSGQHMSEEIVNFARRRNISKIVVGKPVQSRWREALFGSIVSDIVRHSGEIDVYVIRGEPEDETPAMPAFRAAHSWLAYFWSVVVVAVCTGVGWLIVPYLSSPNLMMMIYLLGVVFVAKRFERRPSLLAAFLSVIAFNFFFVPPIFTLTVDNPEYFILFGAMFVVALIISTLTLRLRHAAEAARRREQRTAELYDMSRELVAANGLQQVREVVTRHIQEVFESDIAVLLPDADGRWRRQTAGVSLPMTKSAAWRNGFTISAKRPASALRRCRVRMRFICRSSPRAASSACSACARRIIAACKIRRSCSFWKRSPIKPHWRLKARG